MNAAHAPAGRPPSSTTAVYLTLLGQVALSRGDSIIPLPYARVYGLLVILALSTAPVSRSELARLLWPDMACDMARARLRHALFTLDRQLSPLCIERMHAQAELPRDAMTCDVWELGRLCDRIEAADLHTLKRIDAEALAGLSRAPLAAAFSIPDATAFNHWIDAQRKHWDRRVHQARDRIRAALALRGYGHDIMHQPLSRGMQAMQSASGSTNGPKPTDDTVFAERRWIACTMVLSREPDHEPAEQVSPVVTLGETLLADSSAILLRPHAGSILAVFGLLPHEEEAHTLARRWARDLCDHYQQAGIPAAIGAHAGWHLCTWPEGVIDTTGAMTRRAIETAASAATGTVACCMPEPQTHSAVTASHMYARMYAPQLDALGQPLRRAVSHLAIFRETFSQDDAAAACRGVALDIDHLSAVLCDKGVLTPVACGQWRFADPLLRIAARLRLPAAQLDILHGIAAARRLAAAAHTEAAWHFEQVGQGENAIQAWSLAGQEHLRLGRFLQAHHAYGRATQWLSRDTHVPAGLRTRITLGLAAAERMLVGQRSGHPGHAAAFWLARLKHTGATPASMQVRHMHWTVQLMERGPLAARHLANPLMRHASTAPWRAVAHACRALESLLRGRYRQCMSAAMEAEKWARLSTNGSDAVTPGLDMPRLAQAAQNWASAMLEALPASNTCNRSSHMSPHISSHMISSEPSDALHPDHTAIVIWYFRTMTAQCQGNPAETQRCAQQLLAHASQGRLPHAAAIARLAMLWSDASAQTSIALQAASAAVRRMRQFAQSQVPVVSSMAAELCLRHGAVARAQAIVRRGLRTARCTHVRIGLARLLWLQAMLCDARGEAVRADQWRNRARRVAGSLREAALIRQIEAN